MSRILPMSYAEALRIVARHDERVKKLDNLLGGLIFAAAPFTAFASFALVDPKNEAVRLIREMTGTAAGRIKGAAGKHHLELLEAAHTVVGFSAFFDAFAEVAGLELSDDDKQRIAGRASAGPFPRELESGTLPMPTPLRGFESNLLLIESSFTRLLAALLHFLAGIEAWERTRPGDTSELTIRVVAKAKQIYRERFIRLAVDIPEFGVWVQLDAVSEVSAQVDGLTSLVRRQGESLAGLHERLMTLRPAREAVSDVERKLARRARSILDEPLWRTPTSGLSFPTVREGFVSPHFRIAAMGNDSRPADDSWWHRTGTHADLAGFLVQHLATPASARQPLVVLGHPGAGKTLLSEVVAARIPAESFTTVLVKLRRVDADADPHRQIEAALESSARESLGWGDLCRASTKTKVIIFDGLDELIQATGTTQTDYIERVTDFQRNEWLDGNAVITIITSRHVVMDRVRVPAGATLLRLEDFTDEQIENWTTVWNRVNADSPGFRPLPAQSVLVQHELARQPLLLFLLAIYAATTPGHRLGEADLSSSDLYRDLLDAFITRQVRDKATEPLSPAEQHIREEALRRDLSIAAFALFNRGRQFISEEELSEDLRVLAPGAGRAGVAGFAEPLTRAKATVAAFFFIHMTTAREHEEAASLRSYEFLHATFGEYLVAEYVTQTVTDLAHDWERLSARHRLESLDDDLLFALLSHRALATREPIAEFLREMVKGADSEALRGVLGHLFNRARTPRVRSDVTRYAPVAQDVVGGLAAYTANVATLLALSATEGFPLLEVTSTEYWSSTVGLWQAALDDDSGLSVLSALVRDGDTIAYPQGRRIRRTETATAALTADYAMEAVLIAGDLTANNRSISTPGQRDAYLRLARLKASRWPVAPLERLTPYDEAAYREVLRLGQDHLDGDGHQAFAESLTVSLIDDGPYLDPALTRDLAHLALHLGVGRRANSHLLTVLMFRCPHLLDGPLLTERLSETDTELALHHLIWRKINEQRPNPLPNAPAEWFERSRPGLSLTRSTVMPEMVRFLAGADVPDARVNMLLRYLTRFEDLGWRGVKPSDIANLLRGRTGIDHEPVEHYVAFQRSIGTPESELAELESLLEAVSASEPDEE